MRSRTFALSLVLVAALATGAFGRTEHNSFLNKPVRSAAELVSQLRKDPEVRARFERHFGKSVDQLAAEFSKLKLSRLDKDGDYWVYNVDDEGAVHAKFLHLKRGTAVFVDQAGKPVLKKSCGNAMKTGSDMRQVALNPVASGEMELRDLSAVAEPSALPLVAQNMEPTVSVVQPTTPPTLVLPPTEHHEADIPLRVGGSGFNIPAILVAAGGSFFYAGGGDRSSPVPEPATALVLSIGVAMPLLRRIRRKQD